jgi:glycosyltransferase involved in cell wall biosynthesis
MGVGRYIEYLLRHWSRMLPPGDRVTFYSHAPVEGDLLGLSAGFANRIVRPRMNNALWENLLLPWAARHEHVLFGPSYTLPLTYPGRSVVTIHSVDEAAGVHSLGYKAWYGLKYRLSAHKADRVIVNAHSTKQRVHETYGVPENKIDVIWLGADEAFRPIDDVDLLRATRVRYLGEDRPFVLFVGGLSERRNVPALMTAFSRLRKRADIPHSLLLLGGNRARLPLAELAAELGITDRLVHCDPTFPDHRDLAAVYNAADAFVLPSSSDGFSLTLAEAMSCGTPAITVNCAALGEVAHGFAMTIDTPDVDALTEALDQVLSSAELRQTLRTRGLERARLFRWEDTARKTLDVLRQVATA